MDPGISVSEIHNHLAELTNLTDRFSTLSKQSVEKFGKIIETAQVYRDKMDPLNTYMEALQIQKRNIQAAHEKLGQILDYRKTARQLESVVEHGPAESLRAYLDVLEKVQRVYVFFKDHSIDESECTRLQSLYAIGLKKLTDEFEHNLKATFHTLDVNELCNIVEKNASTDAEPAVDPMDEVALIEIASEPMIESLKALVNWLKSGKGSMIAVSTQGGDVTRVCLIRYQDYRRDIVHTALKKLHQHLKNRDSRAPLDASVARLTRVRPKRPPGFVWDVNARRLLNDLETEELHSERYAFMLAALVKLMQNERRWLLRIQLTQNPFEAQSSLESILKVSTGELINEGQNMIRMMQYAEKRAEFHMVLSLLVVLKKFSKIGLELVEALKGLDQILHGFNHLVQCLLQQSASALNNYVAFLGRLPEHAIVNRAIVPQDATVHELTTNSFLFFENLLEFADVLSVAFRVDEIGSHGSANAINFLCQNVQRGSQLGPQVGRFLLDSICSLIDNLECKSGSYQDELMQLVFQMNNLQYILKTINRTDIHRYVLSFNSEGIASINTMLDERRARYIRVCIALLQLPNMASASRLFNTSHHHLDSKDRSAVKSIWQDFNSGLQSFTRLHSNLSVPDRDLRDTMQQQLVADLVPIYAQLWQQSMQVAFSTRREKYMRISVAEFENKLKQLF